MSSFILCHSLNFSNFLCHLLLVSRRTVDSFGGYKFPCKLVLFMILNFRFSNGNDIEYWSWNYYQLVVHGLNIYHLQKKLSTKLKCYMSCFQLLAAHNLDIFIWYLASVAGYCEFHPGLCLLFNNFWRPFSA